MKNVAAPLDAMALTGRDGVYDKFLFNVSDIPRL
jgi:hypothetical protein